jgi:hypothetical protein
LGEGCIVIASGIGLETVIARSEATKQSILPFARRDGLLRFARNDVKNSMSPRSRGAVRPSFAKLFRRP